MVYFPPDIIDNKETSHEPKRPSVSPVQMGLVFV